jgi:hypothetical protein
MHPQAPVAIMPKEESTMLELRPSREHCTKKRPAEKR